MARITSNRLVEDLDTLKRVSKVNAPAVESEAARLDMGGPFVQHAVAASQTAVALPNGFGTGALTFITAQRAGNVDSITWGLSTASTHTLGTLQLTVNGTATGDVIHFDGGGTALVTDESNPPAFNEGDKLGVAITTDGNWTPTPDIAVWLALRWA